MCPPNTKSFSENVEYMKFLYPELCVTYMMRIVPVWSASSEGAVTTPSKISNEEIQPQ